MCYHYFSYNHDFILICLCVRLTFLFFFPSFSVIFLFFSYMCKHPYTHTHTHTHTHTERNLKSRTEYLFVLCLADYLSFHEPQEMIWGWWKSLAQISALFFGRCWLFRAMIMLLWQTPQSFYRMTLLKICTEFDSLDKPHDRWIEHRSLWNTHTYSLWVSSTHTVQAEVEKA